MVGVQHRQQSKLVCLEIERGDLLAAQTAAEGRGRELYYQLVKRYHSYEYMSYVSVRKTLKTSNLKVGLPRERRKTQARTYVDPRVPKN